MDKKALKNQTLIEAQARIAELEAELKAARQPTSVQPDGPIALADAESWLRRIIIKLFDKDDSGSLNDALGALGAFLEVDECILARVHETDLSVQLFWQKQPDTQRLSDLAQLNLTHMPEAHQNMLQGKARIDNDVLAGGYANARAEKLISHLGIGAYITVPVLHHGKLHSFLAVLQRDKPRHWHSNDIHVAETFGTVLTLALSRQQAKLDLSTSQERFQNAMAATRDGIWEWNLLTHEIYLSDGFYRMLGYEPQEFPASLENLTRVIHPDERPWLKKFIALGNGTRKFKHTGTTREIRFQHKDGTTIWCFVRAKLTHTDSQNLPLRIVGVNSDISKFKAVQEELSIAKTLADSANQAKSEFLARMSHEIRTPMNAIIGMGHLLSDTRLNRDQKDYLTNIDQAANALLSLINEILDFSKIEAGTIVLEHTHFDLADTLNKLAKKTAPIAEKKGLEVLFHMEPEVPHFLKGDSLRLRQALLNLIDNAIKFTEQGDIQVNISSAENNKDYVALKFEVRDTGIGMNPQQISELFTPFMQVDGSSRRRFGGSGLGLTVSKHLIELMHGKIAVTSEVNKGSVFSFTARFGHSQIGSIPMRDKSQRLRHLNTLVVDDNKAARQILTNLATHLDLNVTAAGSAQEAYDLLKQADSSGINPFDLVLMDYRMPHIDGLTASHVIKNECQLSHIPAIILVSAHHRDEVFQNENSDCVENFISKPISQSHLFDAIAEVFGDSVFETDKDRIPAEKVAETLENCHILLAEDNIVNQKVAVGILKKMKVKVTVANNGQEAIEHLNNNPCNTFDAILMDMEMPEIDGYDATRKIRAGQHCAAIPIIAMTAHAMRGDKERCLQAGMDGYITKPVKPELLYHTLATFIQKQISQQKTL
ncbi:response regulator [Simiduia curdlanivorans]|uniref:histidine kinase n=1 Tax=Simiduia curdlanivorans TaxID=1492769 RepID=A0ABV8UZI5_9GAMM|nr:response regulator [Simiduia curdlanivorans]MDN3638129.1 response regulator [Simiduia curdlanivorans]